MHFAKSAQKSKSYNFFISPKEKRAPTCKKNELNQVYFLWWNILLFYFYYFFLLSLLLLESSEKIKLSMYTQQQIHYTWLSVGRTRDMKWYWNFFVWLSSCLLVKKKRSLFLWDLSPTVIIKFFLARSSCVCNLCCYCVRLHFFLQNVHTRLKHVSTLPQHCIIFFSFYLYKLVLHSCQFSCTLLLFFCADSSLLKMSVWWWVHSLLFKKKVQTSHNIPHL